MAHISIANLTKSFGGDEEVLRGLNLEIKEGEFLVLLGPSGCGKTTLLRMIAGLETITSGQILIDRKDVSRVAAAKRGLAMVFQSYALYPHMTVRSNIAFGLKLAKMSKEEVEKRVQSVAKTLRITQLLERKPRALSGGQRQRVAIGRAIARHPVAFLFDEPLSNLDAALRVEMRLELADLHHRLKTTMIYVTHDQMEAMTLADRIVVMNNGVIEQLGRAMELYRHPANLFVAEFIGSPKMNIFPCKPAATEAVSVGEDIKLKIAAPLLKGSPATLGIRPEHLSLVTQGGDCSGEVHVVEQLGDNTYVYVEVAGLGLVNARVSADKEFKVGSKVGIEFNPSHCLLFDSKGKSLINYSK